MSGMLQGMDPATLAQMLGQLQAPQPLQPQVLPRGGSLVSPTVDTSPQSYWAGQLAQQAGQLGVQQLQNANAQATRPWELQDNQGQAIRGAAMMGPGGNVTNPWTGDQIMDSNGNRLSTAASLQNTAAGVRAGQGLNPGQSNDAQMKSDLMGKLSASIASLPEADQHTAYERAVGVLAGKGVVDIHGLPSWEQGGRDFMMQMANNQTQNQESLLGQQQLMQKYMFDRTLPMQQMGMQIQMAKTAAGINLQNAQANASGINAAATAQNAGLNPDGTQIAGGVPGGGKPLSSTDAKALNSATATLNSVQQMRAALQSGNGSMIATNLPRVLQGSDTQKLGDLQTQLGSSVGTLIGSNRLSEAQQKIALGLVPSATDTPSTKMAKLDQLESLAGNVAKGIRPYTNTQPGVAPAAQSLMAMHPGLTPQQAQAILAARGQ